MDRFVGELETVAPTHKPYGRGLANLPAALYFDLRSLLPADETRDLVGLSCELAHRVMRGHLDLLEAWHHASDHAGLVERRDVMVRKLERLAPCPLRELVRTYPVQRRSLHEPVLESLVHDGIA